MVSLKYLLTLVISVTAVSARSQWFRGPQGGPNLAHPPFGEPETVQCFDDDEHAANYMNARKMIRKLAHKNFRTVWDACKGRTKTECTRFRVDKYGDAALWLAGNTRYSIHDRDLVYLSNRILDNCKRYKNGITTASGSVWLTKDNTGRDGNWLYIAEGGETDGCNQDTYQCFNAEMDPGESNGAPP